MKKPGFNTRAIHGQTSKQDAHRAIRFPVYAGAAFDFENADAIESSFSWRKPAHAYSRSSNPTVEAFEKKLTALESGYGAIALSSGMAAISNALLAVLQSGDNIIASRFLFGNTYSLLKTTLPNFGIETRFVDITRPGEVEQAIDSNTRLIFFETIANPQMVVPDIECLATVARAHDLAVMVDNTVTTPYLFASETFGVDIVVHSTTKFMSGGATSIGGAVIDMGTCDWRIFPSLKDYHRFSQDAFLARLRKEVYRNFGSCMSPQTAYLQSLGLETLSLRVNKSCENALVVADFLDQQKEILAVHYPGLVSSPFYELAANQFNGGFGGILSFELQDRHVCFSFLDNLKLIRRATNLNDNFSLIIHPASTIYTDFTPQERSAMMVTDGLIRLSVGIEDVEDIIDDLKQALSGIG